MRLGKRDPAAKGTQRIISVVYRSTGPDRAGNPTAEWVIEWPLGELTFALTPEDAMVQIKEWAAKLSKRLKQNVITVVDWYGVPPGFEEPT